ncbi:hypothetical protein ACFOG5_01380 [Pedobacter fastidiosus]|uniref:Uncharacterized protein n=1 Tax=Pedobacter fastidiosus TaxID=2765361 RepID=A0ABR7KSY3_9SPHI|nr:hypothetical protein [Pedobacter fastidiosus]MBC6110902.1 hypothetical protein [Pedobacter fastidiosus]
MRREPKITFAESAQLRDLLANCLTNIFIDNSICKYMAIGGLETELEILNCCSDHLPELPQIKMAFNIWGRMEVADRHAVLCKFHCLYATLPIMGPAKMRTFIFSALFIHEFPSIFAEALRWPD